MARARAAVGAVAGGAAYAYSALSSASAQEQPAGLNQFVEKWLWGGLTPNKTPLVVPPAPLASTRGGAAPSATRVADYPPLGLAPSVRHLEEWIQLGCGDEPYYCTEKESTFGCDHRCPEKMPDFSQHNNFMSEFLRENPAVYAKLKDKKTALGVTFADCIKTGVDNKGHPHIKTVGATAGDEESYELFRDFFDPVTAARHPGYDPVTMTQPTNLDIEQLSKTDIDPDCKYVLTTRVRTGRSIRGFRLPPAIAFEDRRKLEALAVRGLLNMKGDLKGDYFPLNGSRSYPPKPNGMSKEKEQQLRSTGNLFQEPDSTLLLASGMGKHWPDGRGVFHNEGQNLFVWVNEEDHLRIVSMQGSRSKPTPEGKLIKEVTARFMRACAEVQTVLKAEGSDFMHNPRLGWVLTCPSNLGTGLRAGTMVQLPLLSAKPEWKKLLGKMALQCRGTGGVDSGSSGGTWDISNSDRIGKGEVDLVNTLIEGAAQLVKWEKALETGDKASVDSEIQARMS